MIQAEKDEFLYEEVAGRFQQMIQDGTLRAGERLPSVRQLSTQQGVSIATVLQAYLTLENRGLIEARPQSGYYVRQRLLAAPPEPEKTEPSCSACCVEVGELAFDIVSAASVPDLVPLGAGCPGPELLPTLKLNRALASATRRVGIKANRYEDPAGNAELRRQIARRSLDWGCSLSVDDIIVTFGCMEALNLCLRAVAKPGDTIAVESPTFFGVLQAIGSLGMKMLEIATYPREGMCLDALESAMRRHKIAAVIVTANYQNPLGSCMPDKKKRALVELLARKKIPLIEDDVYGDLQHKGNRPKAAKAFDKHGTVLLCSSFSKTLAPGYRVGWAAPGCFRTRVGTLKFTNSVTTAVPTQLAIADFLRDGGYDHYLRGIRRSYAEQVQKTADAITEYFPAGTKATRPQGGFLLWVELPKGVDALKLHQQALDHKITIVPGPLFSPKQSYRNFIRLSCGYPWSARMEQAMITLGRLAGKK